MDFAIIAEYKAMKMMVFSSNIVGTFFVINNIAAILLFIAVLMSEK
jgi:hypothetical protein